MISARTMLAAALALAAPAAALAGDDILDAIEQARKSYQAGDLAAAKQSLDLASQQVGQKNAENFGALLPGWKAEKVETAAVGAAMFGVSSASRRHRGPDGHDVSVRITGDSAMVMQFAQLFLNPVIADAMGKLIKVGDQRAIQTHEGSINMVVANKYLVTIEGSADAAAKLAYAQAVDIAKLSKM